MVQTPSGAKKNARNLIRRYGKDYFAQLGSKGAKAVLPKVKRDKLGRFRSR